MASLPISPTGQLSGKDIKILRRVALLYVQFLFLINES
jgi:hypothetical protein